MKKTPLFLILSIGLILPFYAGAAEITAASAITKVVVYQDRALVTREAEIELGQGENTVSFENLPSALAEDSLRADGKGASAVSISGVELKKIFTPEEVNPRIAKITEELEKLQDDLRGLQSKSSALEEQKNFLNSVKNFSGTQVPKEIMTKSSAPADWTGLSKFMLDSYAENSSAMLENEKTIRAKNKEIEAKQRELYETQGGRNIEKKTAVVSLETKGQTKFRIQLNYIVPQAAWAISYDAKVYPEKSSCILVSYGNVRQWTGEDWKDATLTLSSAKPAIGGRMPELSPWFVDFFQIYPASVGGKEVRYRQALAKKAQLEDKLEASAMMSANDAVEEASEIQAVPSQANVSEELGSVVFEIAKPVTVLSDNQFHKFPVKTENFATMLDYQATPKLSPYAFIHSKVTNDKDYPLMAGTLNVFVNDNYVGRSNIKTIGRNEEFDMYLGIDEEIKIKRTELIDKRKKTMLGLRTRKDYAYKFELENYKKDPITLTVIDQIPVSKNADIKAELVSSSVKPMEDKDRPKELGILKWKFDLKPKEKQEFDYAFFIEYPADKNVAGI